MKKWNKMLGMVIPSLCLLTMAPGMANANNCYDPCCDPCSFGGFEIGADFIYWKPCVDNLDFASVAYEPETQASPAGSYHDYAYKCLCLGWEPGFRVRFGKEDILCNWNLYGSYLWLGINSKETCKEPKGENTFVTSPLFAPIIAKSNDPSNTELTYLQGKYNSTYQNWDAVISYDISCNRCHSFQPFFGVEGLIFNQKLEIDAYVDSEAEGVDCKHMEWTSDFFGVGMKMGTAYVFEFNCFKFYANASGVIVVGDHDGVNRQTRFDASGVEYSYKFKDADCCQFVPGWHMGLGFIYESDACGCEYAIRAGWEFVKWCNVNNPRRFYDDETGLLTNASASDYTTIGMHGLVLGLDFEF